MEYIQFFLKKLIMMGVKWHIWTRDLQFIIMGRRCYNLMYKEIFYKEMMINLVLIPKFKINAKTKCEVCVEAKHLRKSFKLFERETKLLELIHNDTRDLNNTNTSGGKRYFIIFVDHYSKYCYIY